MAMIMPSIAGAQSIQAGCRNPYPDGVADYLLHPSTGSHAAVLVWPDIWRSGPRSGNGPRLAQEGYAVLTVNPFIATRALRWLACASFGQPEVNLVLPIRNLNADTHFTDAKTFTAWLDEQDEVDTSKKIGTTGTAWVGRW